jgi:hypothetical protein
MTKHAKLSASGSSRWLTCTGSVKAESQFPNTSSSYAMEGTTAHSLAERCLTEDITPNYYLNKQLDGYTVDEEMVDNVAAYVAYVKSFSGIHFYEVRVDFSEWIPDGFGTSDAIVIDSKSNTVHVIDLKYGKGVPVDAENNSQGMLYALGVLSEYGFIYDIDNVVIHIYQPRIKNYSSWSITATELLKWAEWAKQRAEESLQDDAPRTPSDKACQWCKAKATCKALLDHTHKIIMHDFDELDNIKPDTLTDKEIKVILDNAKLIKSWLDAVESHVFDKLNDGQDFDGYKLVEGRSTRAWLNEDTAAQVLLKSGLEPDTLYTKKLISPAQAEKVLKKDKTILSELISKGEGKPTLVQSCDKRDAINKANVFDKLD